MNMPNVELVKKYLVKKSIGDGVTRSHLWDDWDFGKKCQPQHFTSFVADMVSDIASRKDIIENRAILQFTQGVGLGVFAGWDDDGQIKEFLKEAVDYLKGLGFVANLTSCDERLPSELLDQELRLRSTLDISWDLDNTLRMNKPQGEAE